MEDTKTKMERGRKKTDVRITSQVADVLALSKRNLGLTQNAIVSVGVGLFYSQLFPVIETETLSTREKLERIRKEVVEILDNAINAA